MADNGTWNGIAREGIPWYPTVDDARCKGCRTCFEFCSHGVYAWDDAANIAKVVEPFRCVVGCSSCALQCEEGAIHFPPLSILKDLAGRP